MKAKSLYKHNAPIQLHSYAVHIEACAKALPLAEALVKQIKVPPEDAQRLAVACYLVRATNCLKGVLALCRAGAIIEAFPLARALYESFVYLSKLCDDPEFVTTAHKDSMAQTLLDIAYVRKHLPEQVDESMDEEEEKLTKMGAKKKDKLEMMTLFPQSYTIFKVLSAMSHAQLYPILQNYTTKDGDNITLDREPRISQIPQLMAVAYFLIYFTLIRTSLLFGIDMKARLEGLEAKYGKAMAEVMGWPKEEEVDPVGETL